MAELMPIINTDVRLAPTVESIENSQAELRAAAERPIKSVEDIALTWASVFAPEEAPTPPFQAGDQRQLDLERIRNQFYDVEGYGIVEELELEDSRNLATSARLFAMLGEPEDSPSYPNDVDRARALIAAKRLVRLVWKDAYSTNEQYELEQQATHDILTGALNRRGERAVVSRWVTQYERQQQHESQRAQQPNGRGVIDIDLTYFQRVDKVLGEDVGDEFLKELKLMLDEVGRAEDLIDVVRWGGDEFRLLVGNTTEETFGRLVGRLTTEQDAKTENDRQQLMWARINELKEAIVEAVQGQAVPVFTVANVKVVEEPDEPAQPVLFINGVPFAKVRELIVMSLGAVYGDVGSVLDYEQLAAEAKRNRIQHKASLHTKMGPVPRYDQ